MFISHKFDYYLLISLAICYSFELNWRVSVILVCSRSVELNLPVSRRTVTNSICVSCGNYADLLV